jgi:hypothetical protein
VASAIFLNKFTLATRRLTKNGVDATADDGGSYGFRRFLELAVRASGFDLPGVREFAGYHTAEKSGSSPSFFSSRRGAGAGDRGVDRRA